MDCHRSNGGVSEIALERITLFTDILLPLKLDGTVVRSR
jgi:hypothetical protein